MAKTHTKQHSPIQTQSSLTNIINVMHRVSGVGILLFLPFILYCLFLSLNPNELASQITFVTHLFVKFIWLGIVWAYTAHTFVEIRQLFLDIHIGIEFSTAKISALFIIIVSSLITIVMGIFLMGIYL